MVLFQKTLVLAAALAVVVQGERKCNRRVLGGALGAKSGIPEAEKGGNESRNELFVRFAAGRFWTFGSFVFVERNKSILLLVVVACLLSIR